MFAIQDRVTGEWSGKNDYMWRKTPAYWNAISHVKQHLMCYYRTYKKMRYSSGDCDLVCFEIREVSRRPMKEIMKEWGYKEG